MRLLIFGTLAALGAAGACGDTRAPSTDTTAAAAPGSASAPTSASTSCEATARRVVEQLGHRMRLVSLLAPDSLVTRALASAYDSLVTPALLATWQNAPASAPGREVSNPWPARVDIRSVEPDGSTCRVKGDVVFVTTADTATPVERRAVTIRVSGESGQVSAYETANAGAGSHPPATPPATAAAVKDVVRRYYDAVQSRDFDRAFALWNDGGKASGKTRAEFEAGFAQTAEVHAVIRDSVRVEGAAGSEYATVPVVVDAVRRNGTRQHFEGTYALRRSMVDGATAEQRAWHIYRAELRLGR